MWSDVSWHTPLHYYTTVPDGTLVPPANLTIPKVNAHCDLQFFLPITAFHLKKKPIQNQRLPSIKHNVNTSVTLFRWSCLLRKSSLPHCVWPPNKPHQFRVKLSGNTWQAELRAWSSTWLVVSVQTNSSKMTAHQHHIYLPQYYILFTQKKIQTIDVIDNDREMGSISERAGINNMLSVYYLSPFILQDCMTEFDFFFVLKGFPSLVSATVNGFEKMAYILPRTTSLAEAEALSTTVWAVQVYIPAWLSWAFTINRSPMFSFWKGTAIQRPAQMS